MYQWANLNIRWISWSDYFQRSGLLLVFDIGQLLFSLLDEKGVSFLCMFISSTFDIAHAAKISKTSRLKRLICDRLRPEDADSYQTVSKWSVWSESSLLSSADSISGKVQDENCPAVIGWRGSGTEWPMEQPGPVLLDQECYFSMAYLCILTKYWNISFWHAVSVNIYSSRWLFFFFSFLRIFYISIILFQSVTYRCCPPCLFQSRHPWCYTADFAVLDASFFKCI